MSISTSNVHVDRAFLCNKSWKAITKLILVPTPGVTGVTGVPGEVGVPGEFGGIVELGDKGTWLRITSSSSVGEVASVFTVEDKVVNNLLGLLNQGKVGFFKECET